MLRHGMLISHSKNVVVEVLPKILRYSIPLYLPEEKILFRAPELVLEVKKDVFPHWINLEDLAKVSAEKPKIVRLPELQ